MGYLSTTNTLHAANTITIYQEVQTYYLEGGFYASYLIGYIFVYRLVFCGDGTDSSL